MTIEEEFFKAFEIEPKKTQQIVDNGIFFNVMEDECYPEITDRKLLELICILDNFTLQSYLKKQPFDINVLKADILSRCLFLEDCGIAKDRLKQQVKALFEGEE